ncbi:DUF2778 domain-containing protein [Phyllobacterium zundukense]|jgi:hypothetical protein|uniref:DUF2778 domain-containing protein n=1 Tax=Phyllobacterium zundukense TaxID=1867719 RepID=A0ACD4D660_9HYPH|nr:DUF2778 domain-containing protein [Phyllobacterium zundukense]UXN61332.1 DUF2778 domain-containing protein [Phyllobacterium zundukense]
MGFAVRSAKGFAPSGERGRFGGRRLLSAGLLAGVSVVASLGAIAAVATMQGAFGSHAAGSGAFNQAERAFSAPSIALVSPLVTLPKPSKFPRVPELKHTAWQVSTMDEGSVILPTGEISVIAQPKPKVVAAMHHPLAAESFGARFDVVRAGPLAEDAFGARASGIDTMQVASIQTYTAFDAAPPVAAPSAPAPAIAVAALQDAPPPVGTSAQGPFSLVLAEEDPAAEDDLAAVPLPGIRPRRPAGEVDLPSTKALKRAAPQMLAYAPQDNAIQDNAPSYRPAPLFASRSRTAVYSIEAKTVYLPNGERLEAHSGLGPMLDNPRYVHKRMRGATPPHTYNLTMREKLFHGVQAIRLNPVEPGKIFGRDGLLAHTYMLGPRGDSNGCVSIKDYRRFLAAFKRGEITQLVVVARMPGGSSRIASR